MTDPDREHEFHIPIKEEIIALEQLHISTGFSKQAIKNIMLKGAVWLTIGKQTTRIRRAKKKLEPGMTLHLYNNEKVLSEKPSGAKLISDENSYSIWYKPYGMYSQGSKWGDHCTVYRWAETKLKPQRPAFIVHRLDRAATGLIIIAHSKETTKAFTEIFQKRAIKKIYHVIVHGKFPKNQKKTTISIDIDDRKAISHVISLKYNQEKNISLLEVLIETGRKHQIRKHLSISGFPVVGDRFYGNKTDIIDLQLSAHYISFICPLDNIRKEFNLPEEFAIIKV